MEIDDLKQKTADLTDHLGDYAETFFKVTLLNVTQKGTDIASAAISLIVISILSLFVLFFAGFGVGWWLGDLVNSRAGGFLLVAAFYLLLITFILLFRKKIFFAYFRNLIIRKIYE
jgi:ABC-type multidrug transport system fused ATPase/permease subunit